jgi:hypothetical protein
MHIFLRKLEKVSRFDKTRYYFLCDHVNYGERQKMKGDVFMRVYLPLSLIVQKTRAGGVSTIK